MKIISQSTIARSPAYFHLGYLAASHTAPSQGLFSAGMVPLVLGCVLSLRFSRYGAAGKGVGKIMLGLRKDNPKSLLSGLVCIVVGMTLICLSFKAGQTRYAHPHSMTRARMHGLASQIMVHLGAGKPIPENMTALAAQWDVSDSEIQDGWLSEMRLVSTTDEEGAKYGLVSAGEDKEFDTADDLRLAIPYPQEAAETEI